MSRKPRELEPIGCLYGKPDIERIGLFAEMPYMNGKKYVSPFPKPARFGSRNIMGEGRKTKCGTQHGYFEQEFKRLFEGEGINWKKAKDAKKKKAAKGLPFLPPSNGQIHSTPGDYYGCFGGHIEAFGTGRQKPKTGKRKVVIRPNMKTGCMKLGGPGYADIGLSPYPEHQPDPYVPKPKKDKNKKASVGIRAFIPNHCPQPYFDPNIFAHPDGKIISTYQRPKPEKNLRRGTWIPTGPAKWEGGCKGNTFDKWPEFTPCKYIPMSDLYKPRKNKPGMHFYPQSMNQKTLWQFSINNLHTDLCINSNNYKDYEPNYTKFLVDKLPHKPNQTTF